MDHILRVHLSSQPLTVDQVDGVHKIESNNLEHCFECLLNSQFFTQLKSQLLRDSFYPKIFESCIAAAVYKYVRNIHDYLPPWRGPPQILT